MKIILRIFSTQNIDFAHQVVVAVLLVPDRFRRERLVSAGEHAGGQIGWFLCFSIRTAAVSPGVGAGFRRAARRTELLDAFEGNGVHASGAEDDVGRYCGGDALRHSDCPDEFFL